MKAIKRSLAWFSNRYYIRLVTFGTITAIITVTLLSLLSYFVTSKYLENQVNFSSLETVKQIQASLDIHLESVQRAVSPLLHDPELLDAMYGNESGVDYIKLLSVVNKLKALEQSLNHVYSIDIFIIDERILLSTSAGFHQYHTQEYSDQLSSKVGWGYGRPYGITNTLSLVKALPLYSDKPKAYLAVYLNPALLLQISGDITEYGELMVVNPQGFIVVDPVNNMASQSLSSNMLYRFLNRGSTDGVIRDRNTDAVLLFADSQYNSWTVLLEVPTDRIYSYQQQLILIYISICALGLLIGSFLIYIQSRRLYKPISDLVHEAGGPNMDGDVTNEWQFIRNQLHEKDRQLDDLNTQHLLFTRELFFLELLYGHYVTLSDEWLRRQLDKHGLTPDHYYCVMIVQAERIEESNRFKTDEKPLVVLAVSSICKDILQQLNIGGVVLQAVQAGRVILLLKLDEDQPYDSIVEMHHRLAESIRGSVQSFLKFPVSVGIGEYHKAPDGLRISYNEAVEALQYRLIEGGNRILRFEVRSREESGTSSYPVELEKLILGALREGNREDVLRNFSEFVLYTVSHTRNGDNVYLFYHMLYTAMSQFYIHQSETNRERFMELKAFAAVNECQTIHEIESFFIHKVIPLLLEMAEEEQASSNKRIIESALKWIPEHLGEDLSLPAISEMFQVSSSYFSRLFARKTGTTFIEYLAGLRIEASKQKLAETDLPIHVIAREIGYTEQTFRRVFKQMTAQTPTQYRESRTK